jgi:hypothetical protein
MGMLVMMNGSIIFSNVLAIGDKRDIGAGTIFASFQVCGMKMLLFNAILSMFVK